MARAECSLYVESVPQTAAQFRAAVERYAERPDQTSSLTDCAGFIVMEERGITAALAHDRDFEQPGFTALPPPKPVNVLHASTDPDLSTSLPAMLDRVPLRGAWTMEVAGGDSRQTATGCAQAPGGS